jgi:hypothetical protein
MSSVLSKDVLKIIEKEKLYKKTASSWGCFFIDEKYLKIPQY